MRIELIEELGSGEEVRTRPEAEDLHVIVAEGSVYGPYGSRELAEEGLSHHGSTAAVRPLHLPITDREYESDMADDQQPVTECPKCGSLAPHLHPAVQHEGEVQVCTDPFHRRVTAQNTAERITELGLSPIDHTEG